ncbi:general substrate transporter [Armillaria novae-zelandiae]|uniref:General substrate transporter n=1 Tax=Armillaria novae-zelandiae TaxID=153914 RepID=A0AA39NRQ9_9AGAR|nr:general substrate transporter [Armillaria novae-zelandiae]
MLEIYNPYAIAAISALGGFLFGTDISSVSAFLDVDSYLIYFNHPNDTTQGGITAAMPAGAFVGALVAGPVSNRLGRKKSIVLSTVCWTIGCILSCAAQNIPMLVVGRLIKGICVGWTSGQVPVYLAEQSPRAIRGRLVGTQQIAITIGILVMFYVSYGCSFIEGVTSFRLAWGLQLVPGALLGLLLPLCPESCRWLASRGRMQEAEQVIAKIHNLPLDSAEVQLQMDEIREALRIEKESAEIGYSDLFKKKLLSRTIAGMACQLWRHYYVVYVFQMAGLTGNTNLISSSIQYVINFAMTIPALIWVDKWGRRPTLLNVRWSVSGPPSKAVIACSYLFVASFAITWGPVSWIYVSEIFPRPVRAQGSGLATATNWIMNFALSFFVPPAFKNIQWKTYLVFGVFCVASFVQVFFTFHETKGRSLEDISTLFETSITPFSKKATIYPSPNGSSHHDDLKEHITTSE